MLRKRFSDAIVRTRARNSSRRHGSATKSSAPARRPSSREASSSSAVINPRGMRPSVGSPRSSRQTVEPSRSGFIHPAKSGRVAAPAPTCRPRPRSTQSAVRNHPRPKSAQARRSSSPRRPASIFPESSPETHCRRREAGPPRCRAHARREERACPGKRSAGAEDMAIARRPAHPAREIAAADFPRNALARGASRHCAS